MSILSLYIMPTFALVYIYILSFHYSNKKSLFTITKVLHYNITDIYNAMTVLPLPGGIHIIPPPNFFNY